MSESKKSVKGKIEEDKKSESKKSVKGKKEEEKSIKSINKEDKKSQQSIKSSKLLRQKFQNNLFVRIMPKIKE